MKYDRNIVVLDVETSGLNPTTHGLLSIGACTLDASVTFYRECRLSPHELIQDEALAVNGFSRSDCFDLNRLPSIDAADEFANWFYCLQSELKRTNPKARLTIAGHNPGFDLAFVSARVSKEWNYGFRALDLRSLAYARWGEFLSHEQICDRLGFPKEARPHHALTGALSEARCIRRLLEMNEKRTVGHVFRGFLERLFTPRYSVQSGNVVHGDCAGRDLIKIGRRGSTAYRC